VDGSVPIKNGYLLFSETGGFDTPFANPAQGYSTTEVKMILSSFLLSALFIPLRSSRLRGEKR